MPVRVWGDGAVGDDDDQLVAVADRGGGRHHQVALAGRLRLGRRAVDGHRGHLEADRVERERRQVLGGGGRDRGDAVHAPLGGPPGERQVVVRRRRSRRCRRRGSTGRRARWRRRWAPRVPPPRVRRRGRRHRGGRLVVGASPSAAVNRSPARSAPPATTSPATRARPATIAPPTIASATTASGRRAVAPGVVDLAASPPAAGRGVVGQASGRRGRPCAAEDGTAGGPARRGEGRSGGLATPVAATALPSGSALAVPDGRNPSRVPGPGAGHPLGVRSAVGSGHSRPPVTSVTGPDGEIPVTRLCRYGS